MIINCPACQARYNVPESAIGAAGRQLRCAKCGHQWRVFLPEAQPNPPSEVTPAPESPPAVSPDSGVTPAPETTPPAAPQPEPAPEAPANGQETTPPSLTVLSRARWLPGWLRAADPTILAVSAVLVLALAGALAWWLAAGRHPVQVPTSGITSPTLPPIGPQPAGLQLGNLAHTLERRPGTTASSTQPPTLVVEGLVTNLTSTSVTLPDLRIQLLDAHGTELDNWPATFTDTTLQPAQSARWSTHFPHPDYARLATYRAYFAPAPGSTTVSGSRPTPVPVSHTK